MELIDEIAAEREGVAELLEEITPRQLAIPSLCQGWTVRDVGAHLLMPLVTPLPAVLLAMARARFSFDRANVTMTAEVANRMSTAEIVAGLRERSRNCFHPPGMGMEAPLTDLLVHGQDMRRPLGVEREIPADRQLVALRFLTGGYGRTWVSSDRLRGLEFRADDVDWTFTGKVEDGASPALVTGPAEALMLALASRPVALEDLSGDGVSLLAERR